jgi:Tol biopolymer transport system component
MKRMLALALLALRALAAEPSPALLAPGVISTAGLAESGGTFSPDGNEIYFTARTPSTTSRILSVIVVSRRVNGRWTKPEVAPFSGLDWDAAPALSPDGKRLFFGSTRHDPASDRHDVDLWYVDREGDRWSAPRNAGDAVNSPADEQTPSVAADGTLYFSSNRADGAGSWDLYRAALTAGGYAKPELLAAINSDAAEVAPFVTPDQRLLLFSAVGRPDMRLGGGQKYPRSDLYVSFLRDGHWTAPRQLPEPFNSVANDSYPLLSPDGKQLYFTSERQPFVVPVAHVTFDQLVRLQSAIENGQANIYVVAAPELLR